MSTPDAMKARLRAQSVWDGECFRWMGKNKSDGYGRVTFGGRRTPVHRLAYELWREPIPDGLVIDHVLERGCQFRDCINPAHLEAVTTAENNRRIVLAAKTHCPKGHEYDEQNTHIGVEGQPRCRACDRERSKKRIVCVECGREMSKGSKSWHDKRYHFRDLERKYQ